MLYRVKEKSNSSSGQATVEYVLVMIIVIVIILGLVFQFNDAFRNYARNYFGAYLQCLLDNGELPNLGAQVATSTCDEEFQPFNIASGRVPNFSGASSNPGQLGAGGRSGSSSGDAKEESSPKDPGAASGGSETDRSGRPSRFSSSSGRTSSGNNLRPSKFASGNDNAEAGGNAGSAGGARTRKVIRRSSDGTPIVNERNFSEGGRQAYFQASKVDEEVLRDEAGLLPERFEQNGRTKKKAFEQEIVARKIQSEEEAKELSFSNFMRYLLIAAVIIAVILFLAGQFLSISKSMEK
jgi:hypothetical protein